MLAGEGHPTHGEANEVGLWGKKKGPAGRCAGGLGAFTFAHMFPTMVHRIPGDSPGCHWCLGRHRRSCEHLRRSEGCPYTPAHLRRPLYA